MGLGSNEGDRLLILRSAVARMAEGAVPGARLVGCSGIYETLPVGPSTGRFLNAVVELQATTGVGLDPAALVEALLRIEGEHGRVRTQRWAARTLDLDLLLVLEPGGAAQGDGAAWVSRTLDSPRATVPHPRMLDRDFVLAPLSELLPDAGVLDGKTARQRLEALTSEARSILGRLDAQLRPEAPTGAGPGGGADSE